MGMVMTSELVPVVYYIPKHSVGASERWTAHCGTVLAEQVLRDGEVEQGSPTTFALCIWNICVNAATSDASVLS